MPSPVASRQGCLNCKIRKVKVCFRKSSHPLYLSLIIHQKSKCDSTTPQCLRCIKSNKPCPGYPNEASIVFRDMTQISEWKVKSRTAGRDGPQHLQIRRSVTTNSQQQPSPASSRTMSPNLMLYQLGEFPLPTRNLLSEYRYLKCSF